MQIDRRETVLNEVFVLIFTAAWWRDGDWSGGSGAPRFCERLADTPAAAAAAAAAETEAVRAARRHRFTVFFKHSSSVDVRLCVPSQPASRCQNVVFTDIPLDIYRMFIACRYCKRR